MNKLNIVGVIPAAGIGKRVGSDIPKQYLQISGKAIIEYSISPFLKNEKIQKVIVSLAKNDIWFAKLPISTHPKIETVIGGAERVDSVLSALETIDDETYVLVHDAARPCIKNSDINKLIDSLKTNKKGSILATRVRDTMKRSNEENIIQKTVERNDLWHALTPQLFRNKDLILAINSITDKSLITDEASAMELMGGEVQIIEGRSDNLKVTNLQDLKLVEFYLSQ